VVRDPCSVGEEDTAGLRPALQEISTLVIGVRLIERSDAVTTPRFLATLPGRAGAGGMTKRARSEKQTAENGCPTNHTGKMPALHKATDLA
jgi:hypothetical protein